MNTAILHKDVQEYIKNYDAPLSKLAFSGSPFKDVMVQELMEQIESRKKAEKRLPSWFSSSNIYYPPKLNLEQTSSETTANYKASLISGKTLADITGGFGIDSHAFSSHVENVHYFEHNEELSHIATHNFKMLKKTNIQCFTKDGIEAIKNSFYDVIYADPSRRHNTKGKVFFLNDCEPNIPENLSSLLKNCNVLMVKTSPMLDISAGLEELKHTFKIHIVAVANEVKELVWLLKDNFEGTPKIITVNITTQEVEKFIFDWKQTADVVYENPNRFLYEPNAAILKSGSFELLSESFKIKKLHKHTHLYTSEALREFPGRRFFIKKVVPYNKKYLKAAIDFQKANITTRNFPESVESLRKKWKIKEGGDMYLFFTTSIEEQKIVLFCKKI